MPKHKTKAKIHIHALRGGSWEICLFHENHIFAKNMMNLSAGNERIFLGHTFFFSCSDSNHCKSSWPLSVEATMTFCSDYFSVHGKDMARRQYATIPPPIFLHIEGARRKVWNCSCFSFLRAQQSEIYNKEIEKRRWIEGLEGQSFGPAHWQQLIIACL